MKYTHLALIIGLALASADGQRLAAQTSVADQSAKAIVVKTVPASIIVARDVTGPYSQHAVIFKQLLQYTAGKYGKPEALLGIYPDDPDAVQPEDLHWTVAVRISGEDKDVPNATRGPQLEEDLKRSMGSLQQPSDPYKLVLIRESLAAVVESTVAAAPKDGLAIIPWMANNGFVQIAPTRMEYLTSSGDPASMKIRIIVPIKKRPSGLTL